MSEIKPATQASAQSTSDEHAGPEAAGANDIRQLNDLELALTGGGDVIVPWP